MIDILVAMAKQVMADRLARYYNGVGPLTYDALIAVAGYDAPRLAGQYSDTMPGLRGEPEAQSYAKLVAYGLHPVVARQEHGFRLRNPYDGQAPVDQHGLSDPLQLAACFSAHGAFRSADLMIQERKAIIELYGRWEAANWRDYYSEPGWGGFLQKRSWADRLLERTWVPPKAEAIKMPRVSFSKLDTAYLEPLFDETFVDTVKKKIGPTNIGHFAAINALKNERLSEVLRRAVANEVSRMITENKGSAIRYHDIATYLRLCDPKDAERVLGEAQGARQALALVRHDTPSDLYIKGLRALAGVADDSRKEILMRMGRSPTIEELGQVKSIKVAAILNEMPWEYLEPLTKTHGNRLRALVLPYVEDLGYDFLSKFLTDREDRFKSVPNYGNPDQPAKPEMVTGNTSIADWEIVMEGLHGMHMRSQKFRERIVDVAGVHIAFLAALSPHAASTPYIEEALRHHPRWKQIEAIVGEHVVPSLPDLWK